MSSEPNNTYYEKGSVEVATETAVTVRKLEKRRKLTHNSERLVIALVGLPGRGKSFVARKLQAFFTWRGIECKVFNVGRYRRQAHVLLAQSKGNESSGACDANFFDAKNEAAAAFREQLAAIALQDMLKWLDNDKEMEEKTKNAKNEKESSMNQSSTNLSLGSMWNIPQKERVAIYDATNSTVARRSWILDECTSPAKRAGKQTGVVFVESICDDEELLEENFRFKVMNSPDFKGMSTEEAIADLRKRVKKYEEQYETIDDDHQSYIKLYNLSSKLMVNHIYGRMAKTIVPALMAWNIGTRPIFICRPGETSDNSVVTSGDRQCGTNNGDGTTGVRRRSTLLRGNHLGNFGIRFRDALAEFMGKEGTKFMLKRKTASAFSPSLETGTSINGIMSAGSEIGSDGQMLDFPCHIMSSTMPRAVQTATWDSLPFQVHELSNLNPLDKGDFTGMELEDIKIEDPEWYARLEADPFRTRFPGGECYGDLINRLESCIIDMEQQVAPVVIVSHLSVIQVLMAYFRNSPVEKCTSIEVPMHTVVKFTPSLGGGWKETHHRLIEDDNAPPSPPDIDMGPIMEEAEVPTTPIWGDHRKSLLRKMSTGEINGEPSKLVIPTRST